MHAIQFVSPSAEPTFPTPPPAHPSEAGNDIGGIEYEPTLTDGHAARALKPARRASAPRSSLSTPTATHTRERVQSRTLPEESDANVGVLDALPPPISSTRDLEQGLGSTPRSQDTATLPLFSRRPPTTPVLLPQYRYCYKDGHIKPFRAHHCRACGTVRLIIALTGIILIRI
jgi:palmitoyltransferase